MRIVFLQNTIDAQGGIITVNRTLAQAFQAQGDQVFFVSLRHAVIRSSVDYPGPSGGINDAREWSLSLIHISANRNAAALFCCLSFFLSRKLEAPSKTLTAAAYSAGASKIVSSLRTGCIIHLLCSALKGVSCNALNKI